MMLDDRYHLILVDISEYIYNYYQILLDTVDHGPLDPFFTILLLGERAFVLPNHLRF